jgi:hypothetical protein
MSVAISGSGIGGKGDRVGDGGRWNGLYGSVHGLKGFQPFTENKADKSSFVSGSDLFVSKGLFLCSVRSTRGCPTRSGFGLFDLFDSSSRPFTCLGSGELLLICVLAPLGPSSVSLYSGSDLVVSGSESGTQNVPCLDCAVVHVLMMTSAVIQRFINFW